MADQALEVADEFRVVEVRLVAGELDDLMVAIDCVPVIAFGLVEPAKALVAVMHAGEAPEHIVGGLLGLLELPGVDQGEHGTGRFIQLIVAAVAEVRIMVVRGKRGGVGELRARGRRVIGHAAALVFLAAAARAEIIASDFGHLAKVSPKDAALVSSRVG